MTKQQCHSTEWQCLVDQVKGQSHQVQLTKRYRKGCNQNFFTVYTAPWRPQIQRCLKDRELNQARWKPDIADQPIRTARTFVHHYNSTQYCNTETVFLVFSFLQTNITSQMWPRGGRGEHSTYCQLHATVDFYNINRQLTTIFSSYRKNVFQCHKLCCSRVWTS